MIVRKVTNLKFLKLHILNLYFKIHAATHFKSITILKIMEKRSTKYSNKVNDIKKINK